MFLLIGATMFVLGVSGNAYFAPEHQVVIGESLNTWSLSLFLYLTIIPDLAWGALLVGLFGFFVYTQIKRE
jgi:hypothetical protein